MATPSVVDPNQEILQNYRDKLIPLFEAASGEFRAEKTNLDAEEKVLQYNTCMLVKSTQTNRFYQNIDNYVCAGAHKETELLKTLIDESVVQSTDIGAKLQGLAKTIKEMKNRFSDVKDAACKLMDCLNEEERCKKDNYRKLKAGITAGDGKKDLEGSINDIAEQSEKTLAAALEAFDAGVEVSGIQTFTNVDSLVSFASTSEQQMKGFRDDVLANTKDADKDKVADQEAYTSTAQKLSEVSDKYERAGQTRHGLRDTIIFASNPEKPKESLQEICKKVEATFNYDTTASRPSKSARKGEEEAWDMDKE
ncbi:MAG: hypothetical protein AAFR61_26190 [Bacteroidota bacterium]